MPFLVCNNLSVLKDHSPYPWYRIIAISLNGLLIFVQLRAFKHSFIVDTPIDKVWEFYTDVKHLEIVTPKEIQMSNILK